ncbi:MAG: ATP-binding protein [Candidatus Protochlamydia sp.]|nr:ATP-binding protein [Candidatus Protochlamydia sp.]
MKDFEKKDSFYLGKIIDLATNKTGNDLLLYHSKNFTTHAICLGMTGSGKTGLGIAIIEEAGLDGIPAIIIDPKGDLSNLALTFPHLTAEEFIPWVDEWEAEEKKISQATYAEEMAKTWQKGLEEWGQGTQRIKKLKDSVDMVVYTPANDAGIPLSILKSFAAPPRVMMEDAGAIRDRVMSLASSLLGLIGIKADPIKSREHILVSRIIKQAWSEGNDLTMETLIQLIQKPSFRQMGALDLETFFPTKERMALSINLNNLLASPGFQVWMEGEALEIKNLLHTKEGKPKFSIFSIAHLSDSERMFFVTLLLNEIIAWTREQAGTSSLKALLYMDEIVGFFPPVAMPPSKGPMITLLKQARAYGLGIVLATQNPIDIDYKGLSNCGTWFIGKLQTERDKKRVLDGLTIASNGEMNGGSLKKLLAVMEKRLFIMRSIYEAEPIVFKTRWTLSYLRGPLTLSLIRKLMKDSPSRRKYAEAGELQPEKPMVPPGIAEVYIDLGPSVGKVHYTPGILAQGKIHFVDTKLKIDLWKEIAYFAFPNERGKKIFWEEGKEISIASLQNAPLDDSDFSLVPEGLLQEKNYNNFKKDFLAFLYQSQTLPIYKEVELGLTSNEGESEEDFKTRMKGAKKEKIEKIVDQLKEKYGDKIALMNAKVQAAQNKVQKKQSKALWQKFETFLSFLSALLGALIGRGVTKGTISQTGTSIRRAGKLMDNQDSAQVEENYQQAVKQLEELKIEMQQEINKVALNEESLNLEILTLAPRKNDLIVHDIALAWIRLD